MAHKNLYRDLAKLQEKRKAIEAQEAEIKTAIIEDMESRGEMSNVTTCGKATISVRTSYEYTDAIKKLADNLKLAQVKEVQRGKATMKTTKYLLFTAN